MLLSRTTKTKLLHKVATTAVDHHQVRNAILRDSEAVKVYVRRTGSPEVCQTKVVNLRLVKAGKESHSIIRDGNRTTTRLKLRRDSRKWTYKRGNVRQNEKPWHGKKRLTKKEDEIKRKGNLPKLPGMGAVGIAETSTVGTEEAGVVGTAETGAEGAAGIGTTGVAGAVIPTPAAISGPSEVSASREIGVQMKRKYNKKKRRGGKIHTHEVRLGQSTPLFVGIGNSFLQDRHIIRILKNVIGSLRG